MSWRGTLRSIQAASNRAERASRRRLKELEREQKEYHKMQESQRAAHEVEVYENQIELLSSVHKDCGDSVDWHKIASTQAPVKPEYQNTLESAAEEKWRTYTPGFFDKLFKWTEKKKQKLFDRIAKSKQEDEEHFQLATHKFEREFKEWGENKTLAEQVLADDVNGYFTALKQLDPFSEISELGSSVSFKSSGGKQIEAVLKVKGEDSVPSEIKTRLGSGKLSVKQMPKARFYEIYQDYVCGAALRVARELFAALPVETVTVHAVENILNKGTGYLEDQTVLSILIPRSTLEGLNMEMVNPADALENFNHNMDFGKTKGFSPVERLATMAGSSK
jgi:hypothetical protein